MGSVRFSLLDLKGGKALAWVWEGDEAFRTLWGKYIIFCSYLSFIIKIDV